MKKAKAGLIKLAIAFQNIITKVTSMRKFATFALVFWDIITAAVIIPLALKWRFIGYYIPPINSEHMVAYIPTICGLFILFNLIFGCYGSIWKYIDVLDVIRQVGSAACTMTVFWILNIFLVWYMPPEIAILIGILMPMSSLLGRVSGRIVAVANEQLHLSSRKNSAKRTIIFGAGEAGRYLYKKIAADSKENLRVVCYIDDDESIRGKKIGSVRIFGGIKDMEEAVRKYSAEVVIVAISEATRETLEKVLEICRRNKCRMRMFGAINEVSLQNAKITDINLEELLRRDSVHLNMEAVREFVENKVVLVTGGAGSIGSEICRQALSFGCEKLIIFDINENGMFYIDNELQENYKGKYTLKIGSIRDKKRLSEIFSEYKPQLVFHAAAHKHVPMMELSPCEAIKNNVFGTFNVAQAAIAHKADKFILISTDKAVNPTNIMGASKRVAEMCIQMLDPLSGTSFAAVRFGNVLGSNGSVVPFFQEQIQRGGPVTVTHKDMMRYFMTIPEAVQLVLEAGAMAGGGEIFVLDMGQPVKIYDLACDLIRLSGLEPEQDIKIEVTGIRPGEKLFEEISLADEDAAPTPNKKIVVLRAMEFDEEILAVRLKALEATLDDESAGDMFEMVRSLVPTFERQLPVNS